MSDPSPVTQRTVSSPLPHPCLPCAVTVVLMHFPGKCMSHTNSTYTFTTCRILHPSDELTRVTPSVMATGSSQAPCLKSISSVHSTPASTPCTPRRLSLAESFTNLREHTKTTSISLGLVRLLQERGISAAVYNPHSWDRAEKTPNNSQSVSRTFPTAPGPDTMPSTPPNSPTQSKPSSPVLPMDFSPSDPPYENFLASRPASSILKELRGAETKLRTESQCQTEMSIHNLRLVDKVKRFSLGPRAVTPGPGVGLATSSFGTQPGLPSPIAGLTGIRRNRSYPVMVGASMAMKGLGPPSEDLLLPPKPSRQASLSEE
ncbi:hypothetical protein PDJAM_G00006090 [Pangasius djambal]|uniref:Uncharacterized protein n=1 Tax=Pangasius djambal TaxID=1691987 RepID=A0ACC5XYP1_9TELE|nr:hypothetical protein [Pangasius djambal]